MSIIADELAYFINQEYNSIIFGSGIQIFFYPFCKILYSKIKFIFRFFQPVGYSKGAFSQDTGKGFNNLILIKRIRIPFLFPFGTLEFKEFIPELIVLAFFYQISLYFR